MSDDTPTVYDPFKKDSLNELLTSYLTYTDEAVI